MSASCPAIPERRSMPFRFATLLVLFIGPLGCEDKPKGACIIGTGVSRSCGDDVTESQCDLLSGSFREGATCSDLGFGLPSPNGSRFGVEYFDLALTTLDGVEPARALGMGTVLHFKPVTPSSMRGAGPIEIQVGAVRRDDGRALPEMHAAICPQSPPMPEILRIPSDGWMFFVLSGSNRIEAVFDASTARRKATLRLWVSLPGSDDDTFPHRGVLTDWSYTSSYESGETRCTSGGEGEISIAWSPS